MENPQPLTAGLTATVQWVVQDEHLASAVGSGAAPVFSTPALLALCEAAAFLAVAPHLGEGQSTVGTQVTLRHLAATPPGMRVRATATLVAVEGRTLRFTVEAWDEVERIGEATHERAIVDEERFLRRATTKGS